MGEQIKLELSRREFLKTSGGLALSLSLSQFGGVLSPAFVNNALAAGQPVQYAGWEDIYRKEWKWDKITWGSHTNVCLPWNCSFRIYTKNGIVWREEQSARYSASNPNYPDFNPQGCQKGCSFNNVLYGNERVLHPLKRAGKRGEGKWKRITWDDALTEIADSILDAHQTEGPESFVLDAPHAHAGTVGWSSAFRFNQMIAGTSPDINVEIGDLYQGFFQTMGKMHTTYTVDNFFDSELLIFTNSNWSYTMPALYHFITEARDNGVEVVMLAPDLSPSTPAADIHVPVKVGSDAAFWLGVCQIMVAEKIYDAAFVKEQTDLALLVRTDTKRYLRASDVDGGADNQLYFYDLRSGGIAQASRTTLKFDGDQALEGRYKVRLKNGQEVEVTPAFELLKLRLNSEYTPEKASKLCGVHVSVITEIARKMAKKRTCSYTGFNNAKSYHGDLTERSLLLATALSGNWGKPGTGYNTWAMPAEAMELSILMEKTMADGGLDAVEKMAEQIAMQTMKDDPTANDEIVSIRMMEQITRKLGVYPPSLWLYYHAGYKKLWDNPSYQDPAMKRNHSQYLEEAMAKGWWHNPLPSTKTPQVLFPFCNNALRRIRNGMTQYTEELFPKVKMIFTIDPRMSSTAMFCDIVLPAAWYYEKTDFQIGLSSSPSMALIEKAVAPAGECKPEWEIFSLLMKKLGERAKARGMDGFKDHAGNFCKYSDLYDRYTMGKKLTTQEDVVKELVKINTALGIMPKDYTYEKFKEDGHVRIESFGKGFQAKLVANEYDPKKPFYPLRWHVVEKKIYPTYARRAQFYIDHEWFIELGEELPAYKEVPAIGGNHPFKITGGHPRVSVHSTHLSNAFLSRLHRGQPIVHINDRSAAKLGIKNGDLVKMYNDVNSTELRCRTSPSVAPDQVIVYFWEAYQFRKWQVYDNMLVGQPKALNWAGGYEQIGRYYFMNGSPSPGSDRGVRVSIEKI
jgi:DMSO reductase family type II enzyme molybdopterin subunit